MMCAAPLGRLARIRRAVAALCTVVTVAPIAERTEAQVPPAGRAAASLPAPAQGRTAPRPIAVGQPVAPMTEPTPPVPVKHLRPVPVPVLAPVLPPPTFASGAEPGKAIHEPPIAPIAPPPAASAPAEVRPGVPPGFTPPPFVVVPPSTVPVDARHEPGQLLVMWATESAADAGVAYMAQTHSQRPARRYGLDQLGAVLAMFQLASDEAARTLRQVLRREQPNWTVDLNSRYGLPTGAGSKAPARLYAAQMLGLPADSAARTDLKIGVIDTDLDPTSLSPALATQVWKGKPPQRRNLLPPGVAPASPEHGTQVGLLMAGHALPNGFAGAAPSTPLYWAAALSQGPKGPITNSLWLAAAFDWLLAQDVKLVNLSVGGAGDAILQTVVARVLSRQVSVLAAAGNDPSPGAPTVYPAAYPGVWSITSVDAAGQPDAHATRNREAAFAAPGVDLWVPDVAAWAAPQPGGRYVSGSSFATALATGLVAHWPAEFWAMGAQARSQRLCEVAKAFAADRAVPPLKLACGPLHRDQSSGGARLSSGRAGAP